ncbi:MAG: porin [Syntrophotaleaceae bacterium]
MKRMLCILSAAVVLFGLGGTGEAKTLEEILREKGVITEEDYQEAVKDSDLAYYSPGKGMAIQSRDGKFLAHVGGRTQILYRFTDADDGDNTSTFDIRRFKIWMRGHVFDENLFYRLQLNLGSSTSLEDAYIGYTFADPFELTIGQMKPPQARQELTSFANQLFPERSLANDTFNVGRDIGIMASGSFADHLVEYMIGGFNGNGPNEDNVGDDHMFAARIDINPFGAVSMNEVSFGDEELLLNIGGSFITSNFVEEAVPDDIDDDNEIWDANLGEPDNAAFIAAFGDELEYELYTVNLHARWQGATFGAEYYFLDASPDEGGDFDADGYYVQAGYMIVPDTWELAVRYTAIESDDDEAPVPFDEQQYQFGVNYYFVEHYAKIQADFTHVKDDENDDEDDNILRVQAQLYF